MEIIKKKKVVDGQVRYLVKWVGWNNRFNQWKSIDELHCDELIVQFETKQTKSALTITHMSAFQCEAVVESQSSQLFGVDDCEALKAVEHLTRKQ